MDETIPSDAVQPEDAFQSDQAADTGEALAPPSLTPSSPPRQDPNADFRAAVRAEIPNRFGHDTEGEPPQSPAGEIERPADAFLEIQQAFGDPEHLESLLAHPTMAKICAKLDRENTARDLKEMRRQDRHAPLLDRLAPEEADEYEELLADSQVGHLERDLEDLQGVLGRQLDTFEWNSLVETIAISPSVSVKGALALLKRRDLNFGR